MSTTVPSEHVHPHVADGICGKCRKPINPGHRVTVAHIVDRVGSDPNNLSRRGLWLFDEFEMVHVSCNDPFLVKGLIQ